MTEAEWQELASWAEELVAEHRDSQYAQKPWVEGFDIGSWAVLERIRSHFLWKRVSS